jgi:hypothetical protein
MRGMTYPNSVRGALNSTTENLGDLTPEVSLSF